MKDHNMIPTRREFLAISAGAAAAFTFGPRLRHVSATEIAKHGRLLQRIDCTGDLPKDAYFELGGTKIVDSRLGRYRESIGTPPTARFGYRFAIKNIGRPHVAVIRYPDDKQRYMCLGDGTGYDLTTGIFTGGVQPISNTMIELRQVFWPRWKDCSLVFMTFRAGEPAAVASVEIYELADLPALSLSKSPDATPRRELGIQYEDPCGTCLSEGACDRDEWIDHLTKYAQYTGQNLLVYPLAWYHGPQFPSQREPSDGMDWVLAADRKQYVRWTTTPVDWYAKLLERFTKEGLFYQGSMSLLRLGSLMKRMNIDQKAIEAGADTFNNVRCDNVVQSSTNDWTGIYNGLNYRAATDRDKEKKPLTPVRIGPGAYGERNCGRIGPMFNPLHPTVQEAIIGLVKEIGERYAKYPAFQGVSFNMFLAAMPWFGTIHFGYDDYSVGLFEKETGVAVPVDPKAADRFAKRFQFLTEKHSAQWIMWRCKKIRELFGRIHATLAAIRKDLRVVVTLWDETFVPELGLPMEALQFGTRKSFLELYREAGIDIDLYRDQPGLEIDRGMGNSRDRGGHFATYETIYRDADLLEQDSIDAYHKLDQPGAFLFNCWVEEWGTTSSFWPEANDPNLATMSVMDGRPAEGVFRQNSEYPKDGFWWGSQSRITPGFQGGVHFLEPYVAALADLDACRITRGGLFLDKAHSEQLQQFAKAYCTLPKRKFAQVGKTSDPVLVREVTQDGRRYFYVVNRDYYPVKMDMQFNAKPAQIEDLATGEKIDAPQTWSWTIGPYELRSFAMSPNVELQDFAATPPEVIVSALKAETEQVLAKFQKLREVNKLVPGTDKLERRIRDAVTKAKYAWLRRALASYIVRKSQSLS
jgi:hypothetical protein